MLLSCSRKFLLISPLPFVVDVPHWITTSAAGSRREVAEFLAQSGSNWLTHFQAASVLRSRAACSKKKLRVHQRGTSSAACRKRDTHLGVELARRARRRCLSSTSMTKPTRAHSSLREAAPRDDASSASPGRERDGSCASRIAVSGEVAETSGVDTLAILRDRPKTRFTSLRPGDAPHEASLRRVALGRAVDDG